MASLGKKQERFAKMAGLLLQFIYRRKGYAVRIGDVWRSNDKLKVPYHPKRYSYQDLLVYNGRSKVKYGKHNQRLAIDLILTVKGVIKWTGEAYRPIGEYWERIGGRWGGRFGVPRAHYKRRVGWDPGHFEL